MQGRPSNPAGVAGAVVAAVTLCASPLTGSAAEQTRKQVAVSGIISDATGSTFRLNYDGGAITVDMAGWQIYAERGIDEEPLFDVGENVTVTGAVDEALYRARRLEALSVFVRDRDSFYTVAPPETGARWALRPMPSSPLVEPEPTTIMLAGQVSSVSGDELSLDVGGSAVSVDTAPMSYDPLDAIGNQRVRKGDWVQVGGKLDDGFFEERRLGAQRITSIYRMRADPS